MQHSASAAQLSRSPDCGLTGKLPPLVGQTSATPSAASDALLAPNERLFNRSAEDHKLRGELRSLRRAIERESLKAVPPAPFFGQAMRFQNSGVMRADDQAVLQITDCGRVSYSTCAPGDVQTPLWPGERKECERIITYEGVFNADAELERPLDSSAASVQFRALSRHEVERKDGQTRVISVDSGPWLFELTVAPFFSPESCSIKSLDEVPRTPGRRTARVRKLDYIGTGPSGSSREARDYFEGLSETPRQRTKRLRGKIARPSATLDPQVDFSSSSPLALGAQDYSQPSWCPTGGNFPVANIFNNGSCLGMPSTKLRRAGGGNAFLGASASLPMLGAIASPGFGKKGLVTIPNPSTDWKEFYRRRAETMLTAADDKR